MSPKNYYADSKTVKFQQVHDTAAVMERTTGLGLAVFITSSVTCGENVDKRIDYSNICTCILQRVHRADRLRRISYKRRLVLRTID